MLLNYMYCNIHQVHAGSPIAQCIKPINTNKFRKHPVIAQNLFRV